MHVTLAPTARIPHRTGGGGREREREKKPKTSPQRTLAHGTPLSLRFVINDVRHASRHKQRDDKDDEHPIGRTTKVTRKLPKKWCGKPETPIM